MSKTIAIQTAKLVLLIFAVSLLSFLLVGVSPIDPVQANVGQAAYAGLSVDKKAELASYWGSDTPVLERYLNWLGAALHGDLGTSLRFNMPVSEVLATRSLNTLALMFVAWIVSGALGFFLGVTAAVNQGKLPDRIIRGFCFILSSTPAFWLGLLMLIVFSVWLGWFPLGFSVPIGKSAASVTPLDMLYHLVLPALTLSLASVANITLHTREKAIDVIESDYMCFAQARGLSKLDAVKKHGLRNMLLPMITLQFASVAEIFGGSVLIEQVFSYPGLGQATVTAATGGDAALLVGIAIVSAAIVFTGNLIANAMYRAVDPRIAKAGDAL